MENIQQLSYNNKLIGDHNSDIIDVSKFCQLSINSWTQNDSALIGLIWYDDNKNPIAHNSIILKNNEMTNTKTNIISSYVSLAISSKYECLVRVFISGRKKEGILIKMKRRLSNTPKFEPQIPIENDNIDLDTSPVREMINTYEHNIIQKKEEPIQQPKRFSFTKKSPKPQQSCQCAHLKLPPLILPGNLLYCSKINTLEILAPPANNNINFLAIKNKTIYWIESSNISESWFI